MYQFTLLLCFPLPTRMHTHRYTQIEDCSYRCDMFTQRHPQELVSIIKLICTGELTNEVTFSHRPWLGNYVSVGGLLTPRCTRVSPPQPAGTHTSTHQPNECLRRQADTLKGRSALSLRFSFLEHWNLPKNTQETVDAREAPRLRGQGQRQRGAVVGIMRQ